MPYSYKNSKGQTYYLHGRDVTLQGGRQQRIHYFAREPKEGVLDALPAGHNVVENARTGLPFLKRGDGGASGGSAAKASSAGAKTGGRAAAGARAKK